MKILTVGGQSYEVCDPQAAKIDDSSAAADKTWSAQKLAGTLGDVETALDNIIAMQHSLIGGGEV